MILAFAGKIGSGKSTLSKSVAEDLHFLYASFGNYVRKLAIDKGIAVTRPNLQDLGEQMVREDVHAFSLAVLKEAGWCPGASIVLDGIRHIEAINAIRTIVYPDVFKLIYIEIRDDEIRELRVSIREENLSTVDQHPTEKQIMNNSLTNAADLVVNAEEPIYTSQNKIKDFLKSSSLI